VIEHEFFWAVLFTIAKEYANAIVEDATKQRAISRAAIVKPVDIVIIPELAEALLAYKSLKCKSE
jgi:hypothetical protein